jgi:hypothetical protein
MSHLQELAKKAGAKIDWVRLSCEEASPMSHATYIACGAPAVALVLHNRDRRTYAMCLACADHNIRNRGGVLVAEKEG